MRPDTPGSAWLARLLAFVTAGAFAVSVGVAVAHGTAHGGADGRVVAALGRVGAVVGHLVAVALQHVDEVLLQVVAGVIGTDGDA